ncbi:hypothetical protein ACFL47_01845 [Candidatus Latescibacterota bacterium]
MERNGSINRANITMILFLLLVSNVFAQGIVSDETMLNETDNAPEYLHDRGEGIPSSMFGTYVKKGQLLLYPFYEYYIDSDIEYSPNEFGNYPDEDYRGKYSAHEGLIFIGYGITEWLMVEFEAAVISAKLEKSGDDTSGMPSTFEESGLGDVEGQFRWRWAKENERRPELFSYLEVVFPVNKDKTMIGTQDWEYKFGVGVMKGFSFGTVTFRAATEYDRSEEKVELGEVALEYLKKISNRWRVYGGFEGTQDEVEFLAEVQLHLNRNMFCRFNNGFGVTSKATDFAPEVGVVFSF